MAQQLFQLPVEKFHYETYLDSADRLVDKNGTRIFCTDGSTINNGEEYATGEKVQWKSISNIHKEAQRSTVATNADRHGRFVDVVQ